MKTTAPTQKLLFLNYAAVAAGALTNSPPYQLACDVFHCGLIDRSRSLDIGLDIEILDPLNEILDAGEFRGSFAAICDQEAQLLLDEASRDDRLIQVLWSGGIDSTTALVALIRAAEQRNELKRLEVLLSGHSVTEYRSFFEQQIHGRLAYRAVSIPVAEHLDPTNLLVTGEHGDQLFGSDHLQPYVGNGLAALPWSEAAPLAFADKGLSGAETRLLLAYLEPLLAASPVPVVTLFDFFWWLNFTLKWQSVTLRIPANAAENAADVFHACRHFFRSATFQRWAIWTHQRSPMETWSQYKMTAKEYIYGLTGDEQYRREKEKVQSLKLIFAGEQEPKRNRRLPQRLPDFPKQNGLVLDHNLVCHEFVCHDLATGC